MSSHTSLLVFLKTTYSQPFCLALKAIFLFSRNQLDRLCGGLENKMNLQIFGTKKCKDTQKAERFFKERRIQFHFRNLAEKGISKGELENIKRAVTIEVLFDNNSRQFKKRNLEYKVFDPEEELLNDPLLFKTPIVRNGKLVTVGYQREVWKEWI